ncbi:hypothetical protein [Paenibacillus sp. Marseille-Q4541]|uniref:DUF7167 family protein n=1 Tax=Paenibacillus sp. Marseille-Q4541 TaxID=2831522 RepID=UPI001BA781E8|nr:hypothetical protein [Paenibacillus sp. Marseille-Q4541]
MAKFKFSVSTGYVGSKREEIVEIEDFELKGMDEEQKTNYINEVFEEWVWENVSNGWEEIED